MKLTTKVAIAKGIFAVVVSAITLYFFIEKPGKAIFYPDNLTQEKRAVVPDLPEKMAPKPDAELVRLENKLNKTSSARGSQADRPLVTHPNGQLRLSPAITRYFEYFFTLNAEFTEAEILKLFAHDVKKHYPDAFQAELIRLFQAFLNYKALFAQTLDEMTAHDVDYIASYAGNFHALKYDAQTAYFSDEEIELLFSAFDRDHSRPSVAKQKQAKYEQYLAAKSQGKVSDIYDTETQNRLDQLDAQRGQWHQRLEAYAKARNAIRESHDLDEYGKDQAIDELLAREFSEKEAIRVMALERGGVI
ncbi:MAG: lipase secretion chaperone [Cellvibrionales bacterium]|nr:lipase secretion chaperone [Cellvibrionales bacterium]